MTEAEANQILFEQFTGQTGFLIDLRMGRGINQHAIARVRQAFDTLQQIWSGEDCVPKDLVVHLVDIRSAVLGTWGLYPELQPQLESLAEELMERLRQCLR